MSSQKWPGDAKVHVSIVNWLRGASDTDTFDLDGREVGAISSSLSPSSGPDYSPVRLPANLGKCFAGVVPQGKGFVLDDASARGFLADGGANYADVVRAFLTGQDLVRRPRQDASRWIIDFGSRPLEEAMRYPRALARLRDTTRVERESSANRAVESRWWLFGRRVEGMRDAVDGKPRYAAAAATSKRLELAWVDGATCPMNTVVVFALDDDYSFGVLASAAHEAWAWAQSSTLKGDLRYTNKAVFDTFPWPDAVADEQRDAIAEASGALNVRRSELCIEHDLGLTKLYNLMDDGAFQDLAALHRRLDEAVVAAYGWPKSIAQDADALVARLTERNREISQGERPYAPFVTP
ncbi:type IIL restriction-modification enzyme MmeI [Agrococcus sediminis]|uniref:type IIL restriction-modification enzyme MmeI n=1 Tax=Agrococcus sediminis TaxID=2599924 RepID=UPI00384CF101